MSDTLLLWNALKLKKFQNFFVLQKGVGKLQIFKSFVFCRAWLLPPYYQCRHGFLVDDVPNNNQITGISDGKLNSF